MVRFLNVELKPFKGGLQALARERIKGFVASLRKFTRALATDLDSEIAFQFPPVDDNPAVPPFAFFGIELKCHGCSSIIYK